MSHWFDNIPRQYAAQIDNGTSDKLFLSALDTYSLESPHTHHNSLCLSSEFVSSSPSSSIFSQSKSISPLLIPSSLPNSSSSSSSSSPSSQSIKSPSLGLHLSRSPSIEQSYPTTLSLARINLTPTTPMPTTPPVTTIDSTTANTPQLHPISLPLPVVSSMTLCNRNQSQIRCIPSRNPHKRRHCSIDGTMNLLSLSHQTGVSQKPVVVLETPSSLSQQNDGRCPPRHQCDGNVVAQPKKAYSLDSTATISHNNHNNSNNHTTNTPTTINTSYSHIFDSTNGSYSISSNWGRRPTPSSQIDNTNTMSSLQSSSLLLPSSSLGFAYREPPSDLTSQAHSMQYNRDSHMMNRNTSNNKHGNDVFQQYHLSRLGGQDGDIQPSSPSSSVISASASGSSSSMYVPSLSVSNATCHSYSTQLSSSSYQTNTQRRRHIPLHSHPRHQKSHHMLLHQSYTRPHRYKTGGSTTTLTTTLSIPNQIQASMLHSEVNKDKKHTSRLSISKDDQINGIGTHHATYRFSTSSSDTPSLAMTLTTPSISGNSSVKQDNPSLSILGLSLNLSMIMSPPPPPCSSPLMSYDHSGALSPNLDDKIQVFEQCHGP